jgi:hypothetical protein
MPLVRSRPEGEGRFFDAPRPDTFRCVGERSGGQGRALARDRRAAAMRSRRAGERGCSPRTHPLPVVSTLAHAGRLTPGQGVGVECDLDGRLAEIVMHGVTLAAPKRFG